MKETSPDAPSDRQYAELVIEDILFVHTLATQEGVS